jgi:hypothetical protein
LRRISKLLVVTALMAVLLVAINASPAFATHLAPGQGKHTGNESCYSHDEPSDKENDCGWHEGEGYHNQEHKR